MSNPIRRLYQSFFVIGDPSGTTSGAIYGKGIVLPNGRLGEPNSFSHEMYGDVLSIGVFPLFRLGIRLLLKSQLHGQEAMYLTHRQFHRCY